MVATGSALYFLVLLLALYVMDRQLYSAAKLEIIRDNFLEIFHPPDNLNEQARAALFAPQPRRAEQQEKMRDMLRTIVDGPTSMYRMALVDEAGKTLLEVDNPAKLAGMNTWSNNLFIRDFSGRTSQNVSQGRSDPAVPTRLGYITGIYTSPVNVPEITSLTLRYRWYAALLVVVWVTAWLVIYYYLLRPVRNVTLHLDKSREGDLPSLIPDASGALERGYNHLAGSALLQVLEEKLNAAARPDTLGSQPRRGDAIRDVLALAGTAFRAERLRVTIAADMGDDAPAEVYEWSRGNPRNQINLPPVSWPASTSETHVTPYADSSGFTYFAPLANGCMQADCVYQNQRARNHEQHDLLVRACDVFRSGLVAFQAYSEQLFRERSEANISLSRNLGHDLTNVIATSKLELMGIKRVLERVEPGAAISPNHAGVLEQSVRGLLDSTRLMQEMVNIYRSFSYVKRPAYERRSLAQLIEEFLVPFEPALSAHVRIVRHLPQDIPSPIVEPRLLKLALFNVLQNALDALKRAQGERPRDGVVTIGVTYSPDTQRYEIAVSDNGPGIRDPEGNAVSADKAQVIFEYGYSTKGEGGEGLGLNWVRTIMADFHDGGVRAENQPGGGARITLYMQSMERKEARVN